MELEQEGPNGPAAPAALDEDTRRTLHLSTEVERLSRVARRWLAFSVVMLAINGVMALLLLRQRDLVEVAETHQDVVLRRCLHGMAPGSMRDAFRDALTDPEQNAQDVDPFNNVGPDSAWPTAMKKGRR
jgi:hypothetical protein